MAEKKNVGAMKLARNWDKKDLVRVRVLDTGVETIVCRGYQQAYANEGIVYLGEYDPADIEKTDDDLSYGEIKGRLTALGKEFKGNAPKEELLALLKEK